MIDTVGFYVPISVDTRKKVQKMGIRTAKMDQLTGEILMNYVNVEMDPSFGRKIQFRLRDHRYEKDWDGKTVYKKWGDYFKIEFSACKYLLGRNLESISLDAIVDVVWKLIAEVKRLFDIDLPGIEKWFIYRLDLCANFVFENSIAPLNFIRYCRNLNYNRKKGSLYKIATGKKDAVSISHHDSCLYFGSDYDTFKIYAKGPEFRSHDRQFEPNENVRNRLQDQADKILRVELEMKKSLLELRRKVQGHEKRKYHYVRAHEFRIRLKNPDLSVEKAKEYSEKIAVHTAQAKAVKIINLDLFNGYMTVMDTLKYIDYGAIMQSKLKKLLNGTESHIMKSADVEKKLSSVLGDESGKFYFGMYMMLVAHGQIYTKSRFKRPTYYKGLKVFRDNEISFLASDIKKIDLKIDRGFPSDFSLKVCLENRYYQPPVRMVA